MPAAIGKIRHGGAENTEIGVCGEAAESSWRLGVLVVQRFHRHDTKNAKKGILRLRRKKNSVSSVVNLFFVFHELGEAMDSLPER